MTEIYAIQYPDHWEAWFADNYGKVAHGSSRAEALGNLIEQYSDFVDIKVTTK